MPQEAAQHSEQATAMVMLPESQFVAHAQGILRVRMSSIIYS